MTNSNNNGVTFYHICVTFYHIVHIITINDINASEVEVNG
jgi:hypothetical protein